MKSTLMAEELLETMTEDARRVLKVGTIFQARSNGNNERVPCIRLAGKWLAQNGFTEGSIVELIVAEGEIRILRSGTAGQMSPAVEAALLA